MPEYLFAGGGKVHHHAMSPLWRSVSGLVLSFYHVRGLGIKLRWAMFITSNFTYVEPFASPICIFLQTKIRVKIAVFLSKYKNQFTVIVIENIYLFTLINQWSLK